MRYLALIIFLCSFELFSQNIFRAVVTDHDSKEPLSGVNVFITGTQSGAASDAKGEVEIKNIPDGTYQVQFSFIGYEEIMLDIKFPEDHLKLFEVEMEHEAEELEEISVTSTRYSRLVDNTPTRVEVIAGEEINEKISMDPSNISMLLTETTGIQVQQTSASSINNTFRIQGLDGKYTQLLQDGFPLYSGFSGSLSIMQIPPLNLKQVEIIKGSSSTLYGGGAIAGLINLVTKQPPDEREISLLLNGTSALGLDLSGYYAEKFEQTGITFLASHNTQRVYDNNDDNFSDLPEIERYSLTPKVYFYFNEKSTLEAGASYIKEDRTGGYVPAIKGEDVPFDAYTEENLSNRLTTTVRYVYKLNNSSNISFKNSVGYFKRELDLPDYSFNGKQISSFSELAYKKDTDKIEWIAGLNFVTDDFTDLSPFTISRDYSDVISGAFGQAVMDLSETLVLEAGLRTDYSKDYGFFVLPRTSLLIRWSNNFTSRVGGGLGYKLPSLFTEESEELTFRNILPLDKNNLEAERSYGFNFDINYKTILAEQITFSINNLFFYTRINDPMLLRSSVDLREYFEFYTFPGYLDTKGLETNIRITYKHFKFFGGYSYTDAASVLQDDLSLPAGDDVSDNNRTTLPLIAKHKIGLILFYEEHDNFRIGIEGYYTGEQKLSNGETGRAYWINGIMIEKHFGVITAFINFENFLDTRQSKYGPIITGSNSNPVFAEIYAPTDGRIINGGVKLKF